MIRYFLVMNILILTQSCLAFSISTLADSLKTEIKRHPVATAIAAMALPTAFYTAQYCYHKHETYKNFGTLSDEAFLKKMHEELTQARINFDIYFAVIATTNDKKFCIAYSNEESLKEFLPLDSSTLQDFLINQIVPHETPGAHPYSKMLEVVQRELKNLKALRKLINTRIQNLENTDILEYFIALEMNFESTIENLYYLKTCIQYLPNYQLEVCPKKIRTRYAIYATMLGACALAYRTYTKPNHSALAA